MYKLRCSAIGSAMANGRNGLSEGAKDAGISMYAASIGKTKEFSSKYTTKGNDCEEYSISLLTELHDYLYLKNESQFENDWIKGTPDLVPRDKCVHDIKTSWSLHTFLKTKVGELNKAYYWQLQGYMWLTGATKAYLHYCLVNCTYDMLVQAKRRIAYDMGCMDNDNDPGYIEACQQEERNMIFDMDLFMQTNPWAEIHSTDWLPEWNIPASERLYTIEIDYCEEDIEKIKNRVVEINHFINTELI